MFAWNKRVYHQKFLNLSIIFFFYYARLHWTKGFYVAKTTCGYHLLACTANSSDSILYHTTSLLLQLLDLEEEHTGNKKFLISWTSCKSGRKIVLVLAMKKINIEKLAEAEVSSDAKKLVWKLTNRFHSLPGQTYNLDEPRYQCDLRMLRKRYLRYYFWLFDMSSSTKISLIPWNIWLWFCECQVCQYCYLLCSKISSVSIFNFLVFACQVCMNAEIIPNTLTWFG